MTATLADNLQDAPVLDIDPYSIEVLRDPYPFQEALREAGPVVLIKPHGVYATGRHDVAREVLSDHARFITGAGIGIQDIRQPGDFRIPSRLLEVDPPEHTQVRAAVTRVLSPIAIRRFKDSFAEKAEALVDRLLDLRAFDGVEHCVEAFVLEAFPASVGVRLPRTETLAIGEMRFNQSGPKNALYHAAMARAQPYLAWFEQTVQRDAVLPGSIADMLFAAEERGEFEAGVASNIVRSFVGGGTDSTISGMGSALHRLSLAPAQWAQVHADPTRVKAAFEEAIRLESPFQVTYRTTAAATALAGIRLAGDRKIGVFLGAVNRDPRHWERPAEFDITRPQLAGSHLAMGAGAHACIGQMIARGESEALLGAMARRIRAIEPTAPASWRTINQMRALDRLPLRITPA